jgi:hypothetical protein
MTISRVEESCFITRLTKRVLFCLVVLYLVVLISRCVLVIWPPSGMFYNIDELEMTLSSLDRFLGVPSTSLQWPGSVLQMLLLPVLAVDFLVRGGAGGGIGIALGHFAVYISRAYANPIHSVMLLRVLVAVIGSTAPVFAFLISSIVNDSLYAAWLCSAIVALTPVFARQSAMAMGEAVAVSFVFSAVYVTLRYRTRAAFLAGFLFAAALAARITVAGAIILPALLLAFDGIEPLRTRVKGVAIFLAATVFGFLFWCPFVWTEPLRFSKALLGHVRQQPALNLGAFAKTWTEGMGISLSVLALVSLAGGIAALLFSRRKAPAAAALLAALAISFPLLSSGNDVFPRYFLPLLPCVAFLAAVTLKSDQYRNHAALLVLFSIGCAGMLFEFAKGEAGMRKPDELAQGVDQAKTLTGVTALYLPQEALYRYRYPMTGAVYGRMRERAANQLQDHSGLLRFLQLRGIPADAARVLMTNFTEDEQALDSRLAAASFASATTPAPLFFYFDPATIHGIVAERLTPADYTISEALEHYLAPGDSAILVRTSDASLGNPVWKGAYEWFLYRHNSLRSRQ